jgi:hypothetical protein
MNNITEILASHLVKESREVININFNNLNVEATDISFGMVTLGILDDWVNGSNPTHAVSLSIIEDILASTTNIVPQTPSAYDLGGSGIPYSTAYLDGISINGITLTSDGTSLLVDGDALTPTAPGSSVAVTVAGDQDITGIKTVLDSEFNLDNSPLNIKHLGVTRLNTAVSLTEAMISSNVELKFGSAEGISFTDGADVSVLNLFRNKSNYNELPEDGNSTTFVDWSAPGTKNIFAVETISGQTLVTGDENSTINLPIVTSDNTGLVYTICKLGDTSSVVIDAGAGNDIAGYGNTTDSTDPYASMTIISAFDGTTGYWLITSEIGIWN